MWLIDCRTYKLKSFYDSNIPSYAILSHTWEDDELTFQGIQHPESSTWPSFEKVRQTCRLALEDGLDYTWIDTCCIDKSSSAELSEAINSMFEWYHAAWVCYVLLSDFEGTNGLTAVDIDNTNSAEGVAGLARCRWFSRGWCLQELIGEPVPIAPADLRFYNQDWVFLSTKHDLADQLSEITGITNSVLEWAWLGNRKIGGPKSHGREDKSLSLLRGALRSCSIAQRMSWASKRKTTRLEDVAYSLLGIFDINMTLLYGEGTNAFVRLQQEIIKKSTDHSIFAWDHNNNDSDGLINRDARFLAIHPDRFWGGNMILDGGYRDKPLVTGFEMTNAGLRITLPLIYQPKTLGLHYYMSHLVWGVLNCSLKDDFTGPLAILLSKDPAGNTYEPFFPLCERRITTIPHELTDVAVGSAILLVSRVDRPSPLREYKLDPDPKPEYRVNIIDTTCGIRDLEIYPTACVSPHPPDLMVNHGGNEPIAHRQLPNITITLPSFVKTTTDPSWGSARGVRMKLWSDPYNKWEAFYDLVLYNLTLHKDRWRSQALETCGMSAASSLVDICTQATFDVSREHERILVLCVAGLCVEASISDDWNDMERNGAKRWYRQIDVRVTAAVEPPFSNHDEHTEHVEVEALATPREGGLLVARTVIRPQAAMLAVGGEGPSSSQYLSIDRTPAQIDWSRKKGRPDHISRLREEAGAAMETNPKKLEDGESLMLTEKKGEEHTRETMVTPEPVGQH
ncbi:hypothetical protein LTR97_012113 [Elasticomyces elasticus]|uniref:Heterokaryon incompatibility domain-containing protein n=1 Tax=Elasticomyces elasticus TaxID=574655 RepID=A0AAN7W2D3_9PEZI|nr:hypothetical protein LTR97_012113 [Elasticomyces elasticus]